MKCSHWQRCLTIVAAVALFAGCAPETKKSESPPAVQSLRVGKPLVYSIANSACQSGEGLALLGTQGIYRWNGQTVARVPYVFDEGRGSLAARPYLIEKTSFGEHSRYTIKAECADSSQWFTPSCHDEGTLIVAPRLLQVCERGANYPRNSVEGVSLTARAHIEDAYRFFLSLGALRTLDTAQLISLPRIEYFTEAEQVKDGVAVGHFLITLTDNAAFGVAKQNGEQRPIFVVFPKSEEREATDPSDHSPSLWEVPWVFAHEFGHEVFYKYVEQQRGMARSLPYSLAEFERGVQKFRMPDAETRATQASEGATGLEGYAAPHLEQALTSLTPPQFELTAINEGFADLYGFLARGETSQEIAAMPCFKEARAVDRAAFGDQTPKAITFDVLSMMGRKTSRGCDYTTNYDQKPDFADEHIVGAVIAHGFHRLLLISDGDSVARGKRLLKWLDLFREGLAPDEMRRNNDAGVKGGVIRTAVRTMAQALTASPIAATAVPATALSNLQCNVIADVFGGLFGTRAGDISPLVAKFKCEAAPIRP